MSSRPGIIVSHRIPFEGSPPPNQTKDLITIEIRAHWPHNATAHTVGVLLTGAYLEAMRDLRAKAGEPEPRNTWLQPSDSSTQPPRVGSVDGTTLGPGVVDSRRAGEPIPRPEPEGEKA